MTVRSSHRTGVIKCIVLSVIIKLLYTIIAFLAEEFTTKDKDRWVKTE